MKKHKQRPEFAAWERVMLAQIWSTDTSIGCLLDEVAALKKLLRCQKQAVRKARLVEKKLQTN